MWNLCYALSSNPTQMPMDRDPYDWLAKNQDHDCKTYQEDNRWLHTKYPRWIGKNSKQHKVVILVKPEENRIQEHVLELFISQD